MRPLAQRGAKPPVHVTIVADNPETLDGLEGYLRRVGLAVRGTRQILACEWVAQESAAVVLFPDDFEHLDVARALDQLQHGRGLVAVIVVTGNPERFEATAGAGASAPLILTKPAWGWTILDTIRASTSG
jgi:DNA-binding response OmpR family regulator